MTIEDDIQRTINSPRPFPANPVPVIASAIPPAAVPSVLIISADGTQHAVSPGTPISVPQEKPVARGTQALASAVDLGCLVILGVLIWRGALPAHEGVVGMLAVLALRARIPKFYGATTGVLGLVFAAVGLPTGEVTQDVDEAVLKARGGRR